MKFTLGLTVGVLAALALYRWPEYIGAMMDRVPPETPEGHQPKMRTWHNGEEVR